MTKSVVDQSERFYDTHSDLPRRFKFVVMMMSIQLIIGKKEYEWLWWYNRFKRFLFVSGGDCTGDVQDTNELPRTEFDKMINGRCYVDGDSGYKYGKYIPRLSKLCTTGTSVMSGSSFQKTTGFGVALFSFLVAVNLFYL